MPSVKIKPDARPHSAMDSEVIVPFFCAFSTVACMPLEPLTSPHVVVPRRS